MPVHVKLSTTLRQYVAGYDPAKGLDIVLEPDKSCTARDIAARLGLPEEEIKFIMLNGRHESMDMPLSSGDRLAFFPAVGGG